MSITDELREWLDEYGCEYGSEKFIAGSFGSIGQDRLISIADRIDAEHKSVRAESILDMTDENMAEHGWIRLPKDADGEYIHLGDVMEERSGHTFEVASLMAFGGSDNWLVLSDPRNFASFREPHDIRHYHAPTVEDVLREFALKAAGRECMTMRSDLVDEYAAKLMLKED